MKIPYYGKNVSERVRGKKDQSVYESNIAKSLGNDIAERFGFSPLMGTKLKRILYNNLTLAKILPIRISMLTNLLMRYGYDESEALSIIEDNVEILSKDSIDLSRTLAIANQYGFDKEILLNNIIGNNISSQLLYSLTEELKNNNIDVTEANIIELYYDLKFGKGTKEILNKYPLTNKKMFVLSFMYDQDLKKMESKLSLKK